MSTIDDIREVPPDRFRLPSVGERVETPDGEGFVENVEGWEDYRWRTDREDVKRIRARLGARFTARYARVTVSLENSDNAVSTYDVWELTYDFDRDPVDDPPWRG